MFIALSMEIKALYILSKYIKFAFFFFFLKTFYYKDGWNYGRKNISKSVKEKTAKNNSNSKKASFLTLSKLNKVI